VKLRIDKLADIDPLRVALPHGTEVTTRCAREHEGRTVAQGAVGRVKAVEGELVTVHIVGVGSLRYDRSELVPRKSGQLAYAMKRAAAWQALRPNCIIETVVGSRAWGLENEDSDTDKRGLFALPFAWTTALVQAPTDLVSIDGSANYWEVEKAFRQAIRADPNTLETLLLSGAKALDPMGEWILEERDAFVSVEIYGTFGRYALSQLKRLKQGLRLSEHRGLLLEWLQSNPALTLDESAARLVDSAEVEGQSRVDRVGRARSYIKQLYSSLFDQGLLAQRDYASLVAFAAESEHSFDLPSELRPKNAYNLLRLLATATQWLKSGTPDFVVRGELRKELLAIKNQEVELTTVIQRAEDLAGELEEARAGSPLPEHPDVGRVDALLRRVREECARRWHAQSEDAFGALAAPLPLAQWH
jgi:hypothetical protein